MLNITRELVLFTMCGALLAAGSSSGAFETLGG